MTFFQRQSQLKALKFNTPNVYYLRITIPIHIILLIRVNRLVYMHPR